MHSTINCKGNLLPLSKALVMGILNCTPDSFFDGGNFLSEKKIFEHVSQILREGASIIDVGAVSSRPGSGFVSEEEEWQRLQPALEIISKEFPNAIISVDTFRSGIARKVIEKYDVSIINDISAGNLDDKLFNIVAEAGVAYVLMHMQGTPDNMQKMPQYTDVVCDIIKFLSEKITKLKLLGVKDIIIDPGFGFGKNIEHNFEILKRLNEFQIFEYPVLVGISRKSMIYKTLNISPHESLNGSSVLNTIALEKGANILRVHDVKEAMEAITLVECTQK